jgi:PIN domain nuclease of toxin-antitoxin system
LIYLDTHATAWLFAGRTDLFPPPAQELIEARELFVSPMVCLELEYLFETNRTTEPATVVMAALSREIGLEVCDLPFAQVVDRALEQNWTRDPFDRLIVGQALLRDAPLLSKDRTIKNHYGPTVWE